MKKHSTKILASRGFRISFIFSVILISSFSVASAKPDWWDHVNLNLQSNQSRNVSKICISQNYSWALVTDTGYNGAPIDLFWDRLFRYLGGLNNNSVLRSSNYGQSWVSLSKYIPHIDSAKFITSISFMDTLHGFMTYNNPNTETATVYESFDGGLTWKINLQLINEGLTQIKCVDSKFIFAIGKNLYKSLNSGKSWETIVVDPAFKADIYKKWNYYRFAEKVDTVSLGNYLLCAYFINQDTGWASSSKKIMKTNDGGKTWLNQFDLIDKIIVKDSLHINDTEDHYTHMPWYSQLFLGEFSLADNNKIWLANGDSRLFYSTDGGDNWNLYQWKFDNTKRFASVFFINKNLGYVCGSGIFKTTNGGETWNKPFIFDEEKFNNYKSIDGFRYTPLFTNICFLNDSVGYAGTSMEYIYRRENWGRSPNFKANVTLSGLSAICRGDSVELSATPDSSIYSFLWSTGETTSKITVKSAGIYKVVITDNYGFSDSASVQVLWLDFIADIKQISKLCNGQNATLIALPNITGFSYLWSTGDTTDRISVTKPGKYSVILTYDNFCSDTAEITISENPKPPLTISGDSLLCPDKTGNLFVLQDFVSYKWNTGETSKSISVKQPGVYSVVVADSNGCIWSDSINVIYGTPVFSEMKDINFGIVKAGSTSSQTFTITNLSNFDVSISNIYIKGLSGSIFSVTSNPTAPTILATGQKIEISPVFAPLKNELYSDSIIIIIDYPCSTTTGLALTGTGQIQEEASEIIFRLPDTTGIIGTSGFQIPLYVSTSSNKSINNKTYSAEISYNAEYFYPDNSGNQTSTVVNGDRVIKFNGNIPLIDKQERVVEILTGTLLLAGTDRIPLRISDLSVGDTILKTTKHDGSLAVRGACSQDLRLVMKLIKPEITLSPNPVTDFIEISVGSRHASTNTDIRIFNVFGEMVVNSSEVLNNSQFSIPNSQLRIDVSGLPSGVYFVRVGDKVEKFIKI